MENGYGKHRTNVSAVSLELAAVSYDYYLFSYSLYLEVFLQELTGSGRSQRSSCLVRCRSMFVNNVKEGQTNGERKGKGQPKPIPLSRFTLACRSVASSIASPDRVIIPKLNNKSKNVSSIMWELRAPKLEQHNAPLIHTHNRTLTTPKCPPGSSRPRPRAA